VLKSESSMSKKMHSDVIIGERALVSAKSRLLHTYRSGPTYATIRKQMKT
jgi:hypothetical protein